jgi:hypothetical protein
LFGFRERERNGNQEREREKEKKWKIVLSSLFRLSRFTIEKSTRYADVTVLALRLLGV